MKIDERKQIIEEALTVSFVDDYPAYKNTIEVINADLKKSGIKYQYSYDEFCVSFLNQTLKNLSDIDIFTVESYNQFYINFWQFNLYNLQCMLSEKLEELGYNFDEFYQNSNMKNKIIANKVAES